MQRFILLTCLTAFVMASPALAQQMEDVVHLKNGGLVRGTIIEQIPSVSLKIKTREGNVFVYTMDEIAKMSKEPVMGMRGHIGVGAKKKNPWISFGLSALITGGGQFYNGQHSKGVAQLGGVILGIGLMVSGFEDNYTRYAMSENSAIIYEKHVDPDDDDRKAVFGFLLFFGSYIWSVVDAPISANSINQQPSYGHLIELGGSRTTLGVDPVVSHKNLGTRLTLHF